MENKTKEELVELVAAQTKMIDRLTLELAARQPLADSFVPPFDLTCVINWLENGCDPKEAAKELRIYQGRMSVPAQVAPSVTVDTPEIQRFSHRPNWMQKDSYGDFVEYAPAMAHTARAVAAAKQEGWDSCALANQELVRQLRDQIAAQPVAGELPPLPEPHPTHYRERSLTLERLEMYTDEQMREYGRLCRAAQPVQQPAPTYERKTVSIPNKRGPFNPLDTRVSTADQFTEITVPVQQPAAAPTQYGLAAYAQANADFRTAPDPAAGVQGDAWRGCIAQIVVDTPMPKGSDKYQSGFVDAKESILSRLRDAGYLNATASQPDSGRSGVQGDAVLLAADRVKRVYIAGPMTGIADYNFPAFNERAAQLRADGWHVENPAEHGIVEGADWADYLRHDIARIATCDTIMLLPGWSKSKGAKLEVHIAQQIGMAILLSDGAEPVQPDSGRDAALGRIPTYGWSRDGMVVFGHYGKYFEVQAVLDALAAHPANGAQAEPFNPTQEQFEEWCERYDMQPNISREAFDDAASLYLAAAKKGGA